MEFIKTMRKLYGANKTKFFCMFILSLVLVLQQEIFSQPSHDKGREAQKNSQSIKEKLKTKAKSQEKERQLCASEIHSQYLTGASFSQNGSKLLSSSKDGTIRLWDIKTGKQLKCLKINEYGIGKAFISPNGKLALVTARQGIENNVIQVWDLEKGKQVHKFVFEHYVANMFFLPNDYKAIVSTQQKVILLDLKRKKELYPLPDLKVYKMSFSANGHFAISQNSSDSFSLIELSSFKELQHIKLSTESIETIAISPDATIAVSNGYSEDILRIWDTKTGKELQCYSLKNIEPRDFISKILISKDNKFALLAGGSREISGEAPAPPERVELAIYLFNIKEGKQERAFGEHRGWILDISISSDNRFVCYIADDGIVHTTNIETGEETNSFKIATARTIRDYFD